MKSEELKNEIADRETRLENQRTAHTAALQVVAEAEQAYVMGSGGLQAVASAKTTADVHDGAIARLESELDQLRTDHSAAVETERCGVVFDELTDFANAGTESLAELNAAWSEGLESLAAIIARIETAQRTHYKNRIDFHNKGSAITAPAKIADELAQARPAVDVIGICNGAFGRQLPFDRSSALPVYIHLPYRTDLARLVNAHARRRFAEDQAAMDAADAGAAKSADTKDLSVVSVDENNLQEVKEHLSNSLVRGRVEVVRS